MMCIHAYFNLYVQAKKGWEIFMKRRTAVKKLNSLSEATASQLECHNDVCAICFQDLQSARVTNCNHYFHSVCLRKWLYLQDRCPMCHEPLYIPEPDPNIENRNNAELEENMNDAHIENIREVADQQRDQMNGQAPHARQD